MGDAFRISFRGFPAGLALALLCIAPANAQTNPGGADDRERLAEELAEELGTSDDATTNGQAGRARKFLRNPGPSLTGTNFLDISAVWFQTINHFSDVPTPRLDAHDPSSETDGVNFQLQELELGLSTYVDPYVRGDIFLSVNRFGIEIEEGYLTTLQMPWNLQMRAGQFYAPFGRFNQVHYLEVTPFVDQPLVNRRFFGSEQLRGLGYEASWLVPFLPWFAEVSAAIQTADNEVSLGIPAESTSGIGDFLTTLRVRQFWDLSEAWALQLGGSFAQSGNATGGLGNTDENRTYFYGADLLLRWRDTTRQMRWVNLQAEYIVRQAEIPGGRTTEGGLYAWIEARVDKNWALATRFDRFGIPSELDGAFVIAAPELAEWHRPIEQFRWGASVSYYFSEFFRLRAQYNYDRILENFASPDRDVHEAFFQFEFVIGPHGAHAY